MGAMQFDEDVFDEAQLLGNYSQFLITYFLQGCYRTLHQYTCGTKSQVQPYISSRRLNIFSLTRSRSSFSVSLENPPDTVHLLHNELTRTGRVCDCQNSLKV